MILRDRKRPLDWKEYRESVRYRWILPFHSLEWIFQWAAYYLSRWAFIEVLEYLGTLSVLVAVLFYFSEKGDRMKQKHYQAWQVINTAQGKGGSGGRIEALQELNADKVPLVGVDASGAFLQGVELRRANLLRDDFESADLRNSVLDAANLEYADLRSANLRHSNLRNARMVAADMEGSDMVDSTLAGADLSQASLKSADLRHANLLGIRWQGIAAIDSANIYGVQNAPPGFTAWALQHGAVSVKGGDE
jgi:hypothetical protein